MTYMKKIAASISVIGLMAAAPAAMANGGGAVSLTQTSLGFYSGTFSQTYLGATNFTDDWSFTLPVGPAGQAVGTAIANFNPNGALSSFISAGSIWDLTTGTQLVAGFGSFSGGIHNVQFTLPGALVPNHTYALRLTGMTLASGGSYAGSINVTPVPEPESYALFLAGLGLMGFIARRRTSV
jgi:hypothetical protein